MLVTRLGSRRGAAGAIFMGSACLWAVVLFRPTYRMISYIVPQIVFLRECWGEVRFEKVTRVPGDMDANSLRTKPLARQTLCVLAGRGLLFDPSVRVGEAEGVIFWTML